MIRAPIPRSVSSAFARSLTSDGYYVYRFLGGSLGESDHLWKTKMADSIQRPSESNIPQQVSRFDPHPLSPRHHNSLVN
jgi:hypothetical protein